MAGFGKAGHVQMSKGMSSVNMSAMCLSILVDKSLLKKLPQTKYLGVFIDQLAET